METGTPTMNWQEFRAILQQHPGLLLQFQYAGDKTVNASYHITEIKQAPIVSVDCGGAMNSWTEIIVQLWEPPQQETDRAMSAGKALSIMDIVEAKLSLHPKAIVKIEFGNAHFDTRQMYPADCIADGENLMVKLTPDFTRCKAIGRGGNCGTTVSEEACCTPVGEIRKEKIELASLGVGADACKPGSGCC